ncbi:MAG TPA: hypothetical protein VII23_19225 [Terriglobales bacterium]
MAIAKRCQGFVTVSGGKNFIASNREDDASHHQPVLLASNTQNHIGVQQGDIHSIYGLAGRPRSQPDPDGEYILTRKAHLVVAGRQASDCARAMMGLDGKLQAAKGMETGWFLH